MKTRHGNLTESMRAAIRGVVTAIPANELTNAGMPPGADEAAKMTGVLSRRHVTGDQSTESLCLAAAERLLADLDWDPDSIRALVYVTQTPGLAVPASAYTLHAKLGLPLHCPALQVNWSCAGYVNGLWLAMKLTGEQQGSRVLLLVGDTSSRIVDPADRATGPLFGDAGSATAIEGGATMSHVVLGSDGNDAGALQQGHGEFLNMDGASVFSFSLRRVPPLIEDILDIMPSPDFLLFHQANRFMLQHLVTKAKLLDKFTPAQIPSNVAEFGNCSCASIPLLLCESVGQAAAQRSRLALFGFGAGWSWGGALVSGMRMDVAELIEV